MTYPSYADLLARSTASVPPVQIVALPESPHTGWHVDHRASGATAITLKSGTNDVIEAVVPEQGYDVERPFSQPMLELGFGAVLVTLGVCAGRRARQTFIL
jgi:hypothetical protein